MTVAAEDPRKEFAGNGVTVAFTIAKVYDQSHVVAYLVEDADPTNVTTWALTTDFTVSNVGAANATLTAVVAPPSGYTLVTDRVVPNVQEHDYTTNDDFPAESHERALDLDVMQIQQLASRISRAFRLATSDISGLSLELSGPTATYFIRVNAAGTALEFYDIGSSTLAIPADASVTLAKMGSIAQYQMYLRTTAGTGAPELITSSAAVHAFLISANQAAMRSAAGAAASGAVASSGITVSGAKLVGGTTTAAGAMGEITVGSGLSLSGGTLTGVQLAGHILQSVRTETATSTTVTSTTPCDTSIPQIGEGQEITTRAITPTEAGSLLKVTARIPYSQNSGAATSAKMCFHLHQDATANAFAAQVVETAGGAGTQVQYTGIIELVGYLTAASTSATTIKLRAGSNGVGSNDINPASLSLGGLQKVILEVEEIKV